MKHAHVRVTDDTAGTWWTLLVLPFPPPLPSKIYSRLLQLSGILVGPLIKSTTIEALCTPHSPLRLAWRRSQCVSDGMKMHGNEACWREEASDRRLLHEGKGVGLRLTCYRRLWLYKAFPLSRYYVLVFVFATFMRWWLYSQCRPSSGRHISVLSTILIIIWLIILN